MPAPRTALSLACVVIVAALTAGGREPSRAAQAATFAGRVAALSEPGGYFDTDNLISNERSFLSVLPALRAAGVRGGAYLGVGPDQNFSYIAEIQPAIALMVDIRRDNLLLHLLFKALFSESPSRIAYLAQLCGRPIPADAADWHDRPIDRLVDYLDRTASHPTVVADVRARLRKRLLSFDVPLSDADMATIARFHHEFVTDGLGLQFRSTGRAPQAGYPTFRDLIRAQDGSGRQVGFLADEERFQFVKSLQRRDLIIPVVGDLAGPKALKAIARFLAAGNLEVSAFYTSNVEFYLARSGSIEPFLDNLSRLPWAKHGVIIRSVFGQGSSISEIESAAQFLRAPSFR